MEQTDNDAEFIALLTEAQPKLFAYISMLLGGTQESANVLQETNVVLWKKSRDFRPGTNFTAWAREIAYFKVLSYLRDRKRSRVIVDQQRIEAALAASTAGDGDADRRIALRHCLSELNDDQLDLLRLRYRVEAPLTEIASGMGKSEAAIKMSLRRLRLRLLACIQRRMGASHA